MAAIRKLSKNFTEAEIDEEIIVMRLDNGELLSLVDTGSAVWRLIDGVRDRDALVAALCRDYEADTDEITSDVAVLLSQLNDAGLIAES